MSKLNLFYCRVRGGINRFFRDEDGASGIEYALIAVMVAVVLAGFIGAGGIDEKIEAVFNSIQTALTSF
ncbi:Flp family type IVb pilin [Marinobacterium nitratireducens]|nr:Flp family type IVb pilin [Marinobacterium nitratireducens]